ncbi:MFS-type transporter SLC18B1-like isoform X1 [Octopus vulgaris]|uniref:MFS-type transporter SLC18B1-like isoform X1 n=1 Tax=Octopus vulgaris TaxID=6645 RepID=A0AA36B803_OCTVU|nr:MFS-type transporter SLC18B1-like isoform X1 [Octopus vulgaris]
MPNAFLVRSKSRTEDYFHNDTKVVEAVSNIKSVPSDTDSNNRFLWSSLSYDQKLLIGGICLSDLLSSISLSIMAPFFPKEAEDRGISITTSGWIFGVFSLTSVFMSVIFGRLVSVVGTKFLFLSGLFFAGGCTILFGFLQFLPIDPNNNFHFLILCFVLRVFMAIGCTAYNCSSFTIMSLEFPDDISTAFGITETFVGIGLAVGPALGGALYSVGGFILPFVVVGSIFWCVVPFTFWILSKRKDWKVEQKKNIMRPLLKSPMLIVMCFVIFMSSTVWAGLDPILEPHLRMFSLSGSLVGLVFLLISVTYAIASPFWGKLSDRVDDANKLLIAGFFMIAFVLLFLGPVPISGIPDDLLWLNIICLALLGIFVSLTVLPTYDMLLELAIEAGLQKCSSTYGLVSGIWGSMYAFGEFVGPSLSGFLMDSVGFQWCTTYMAIGCFSAGLLLFFIKIFEDIKEYGLTKLQMEERNPLLDADTQMKGFFGSYSI